MEHNKYIRYLHAYYNFRILIGLISSVVGAFIAGIMLTTSSSAQGSIIISIFGGIIIFIILILITTLIPSLALKELDSFKQNRKLVLNYIDAIFMLGTVFPIGLWQVYTLHKVKTYVYNENNTINTLISIPKNSIALYILIGLLWILLAMHFLTKYFSQEEKTLINCDEHKIFTKKSFNILPTSVFYANKLSLSFHPKNYSRLGKLEGDNIVLTNPYEDVDAIKECLSYSGRYRLIVKEEN